MPHQVSHDAGLHVRYEKAGLILDALPIPQSADAIILESNVRLPADAPREKQDFTLQCACHETPPFAELVMRDKSKRFLRVFFRLNVAAESSRAIVPWREHLLGEIDVPIVKSSILIESFALEMPTVHASLAGHAIAGRTFVTGQAKNLFASAVARSQCTLAAANDWDFHVQVRNARDENIGTVGMPFTSDAMRRRETLTTALLPRLPKIGAYEVSWHLAARTLAAVRIRVISKRTFSQSLRVSATRFRLKMKDGEWHSARSLPGRDGRLALESVDLVTPVFYVSSKEPGIAGVAPFTIRAMMDGVLTTLAIEKDVAVTDGLRAVALAGMPATEIQRVKHFTLASGEITLGNLATEPAPAADFTAEGGFAPLDDFLWSPAAEEQLNDRLGKLLDGE